MNNPGYHEVHIACKPRSGRLRRLKQLLPDLRLNKNCDPANIPPKTLCFEYPSGREAEFNLAATNVGLENMYSWGIGGVVFNACFALGDYLYAVADDNFLHVWDIKNPSAPASVGSLNIGGSGQGIWIEKGVCYTVDNNGLLVVSNIDDPAAPFVEPNGVTETGQNWSHIRASGDIGVLSGAGADFVALYDLSIRPPREIQNTDTLVGSQAALQGRRLFFGDTSGSPRAQIRSFRIGGMFCHAIDTFDLFAEHQVATFLLRAYHAYITGELVADRVAAIGGDGDTEAGSVSATSYLEVGGRRIVPVTGDPNTVVTAPIGSIGLSDDGSAWRNTDGATAWTAM